MANRYTNEEYKRKKYEEVCRILENEGYTMLSPAWEGFRAYYEVKCQKGHKYKVQWAEFHRGRRCRKCHNESLTVKNPNFKGMKRDEWRAYMDQKFKSELTAEGYTYDDRFKYKNNQTALPVTCPNGHKLTITWNAWQTGRRCRECFRERVMTPEEKIAQELAEAGCEYLGGYRRVDQPFKYRCSCGNKAYIRIKDFRNGVRCSMCGGKKAKETRRLKKLEEMAKIFEAQEANS